MNERKMKVIAAAQQIFEEKGVVMTSVQDILTAAGISKGTFYNYFTSKNECLLAILEMANEESIERRRKLQLGKDRKDKTIFAQQIMTRAHVDRERNLLPIYEAVFFSRDDEMRSFVKKQYLNELTWISGRILEVYGTQAKPYATDGAVMLLGIMQHILHIIKIGGQTKDDVHYEQLVPFAIRRLDDMMEGMVKNNDKLLGNTFLENENRVDSEQTKEEIVQNLRKLLVQFKKEKEVQGSDYVEFLIDELITEKNGPIILGSVTKSFRQQFAASEYASEVQTISSQIDDMQNQSKHSTQTMTE